MKQKVTESQKLDLVNFEKVFKVYCNTNGIAIGILLSQEGRLIEFFSEKLDEAKRNYLSYDQ